MLAPCAYRTSNLRRHSSAGLSFYEDIRVAESGGEGDAAGGGCARGAANAYPAALAELPRTAPTARDLPSSARSGVAPCQRRYADCEDQNSPLEDRLKVRGCAENSETVESDCEDEHAHEGADDMKLAFS
jgi:hypothetical protein